MASGGITNEINYSLTGGIVGNLRANGLVTNCYNTATITNTSVGIYTGGITGINQAYDGETDQSSRASTIQYSYNSGSINSQGSRVGGITGQSSNYCFVKSCYCSDSALIRYNLELANTLIGEEESYIGKIIGQAMETNTTYIDSNNTFTEEYMPTVYNVVNNLNNDKSEIWANDELQEGSLTEYKYNEGYPILKWELI